ncbi:hypothetical protein MAR_038122 [Mya arenaria]|uniref:ZP domain-containing protein n=1 Tax=Mya arenaria TaxID=6604 RepID=A0ABY7FQF2_MYAAR|nr:hypothetical protein MAR_038122 [Mya arenaria]
MGMLRVFIAFAVIACTQVINGQRTPSQEASAVCIKEQNKTPNQVRMTLSLNRKTDPLGVLVALQSSGIEDNTCSIESSGTGNGGVYNVVSEVPVDNSIIVNGCGVNSVLGANNVRTMTWRFRYYEFPQDKNMDYGYNRIYTVTCSDNNIPNNRLQSQLTVETPNQSQNVPIYTPAPTLQLLYASNNQPVTGSVAIGTLVKLRLNYPFGTFRLDRHYGATGLLTMVDNTPTMNSGDQVTFFNNNGCPVSSSPNPGYRYLQDTGTDQNNNRVFVQESGTFNIFSVGNSNALYIITYYDLCHGFSGFRQDQKCENPCSFFTNARRRRSEPQYNTSMLEIRLEMEGTPQQNIGTEDEYKESVYVLIGACALVCVILLVLLFVAVCLFRKRNSHLARKERELAYDNKTEGR